jgi:hypothetical protein
MSLYAKRLEKGRFIWPSPSDGVVAISASQLAYTLDGIDWRNPAFAKNVENKLCKKRYRMAAAQGDPKAQDNLGFMYANGEGLLKTFHADICGGVWLLKAKALRGRASTPFQNS